MDGALRLSVVPFLVAAVALIVLTPVMAVDVYLNPSPERIFVLVFVVGCYPALLALLQAARIEHFMVRSIDAQLGSRAASMLGPQFRQIWRAGEMLASELESRRNDLDIEVMGRAERLIRQHRWIKGLIWPGFAVSAVGGLGLLLLQT